jgi:hypothetical protein
MIGLLKCNQNRAFAQAPERQSKSLQAIIKTPGYSHTAGVFARTHTYKRAPHGRLWLEASEAPHICDFERGPFLNLYKIAHNKSTVDKWDNFYSPACTSPAASISVRANHWPRSVNPAEPYCRFVVTENMPSRERSATVTPEIGLPCSVPHQQPLSV